MDLWLWSLCFLPVCGALSTPPEVKLEAMLGGSITIECPLPRMSGRLYLCRQVDKSGSCVTVVTNHNFVRKQYKDRVTLTLCPDKNLFLVEVKELNQGDSGTYACGTGIITDRGKTQQVTLDVHSGEYDPFWEEEGIPEPPPWFRRLLPAWLKMPAHASSFEFISKAPEISTSTQRTTVTPAHDPSTTTTTVIVHHPRVSRSSSVEPAKPTTLPPSTAASKTLVPEGLLRPQTASDSHPTRLHRQRVVDQGPGPWREDHGFHILIPVSLGLILLALLGLVAKRVVQRRKALSRRARRLAVRMSALETSQRPRVSPRPRSQNNIYSACPRRTRWAQSAGEGAAPVPGPAAPAPPAPPQVSEAPWPPGPSLKTSCDSMSFYHKPATSTEDSDTDDYVNISGPTHPSSGTPGPRPWCQ